MPASAWQEERRARSSAIEPGSPATGSASSPHPASSSSVDGVRSTDRGVRLQALSPRATLARGYSIVRVGAAVVRDAATVAAGDRIDVELAAGALGARVEEVRR